MYLKIIDSIVYVVLYYIEIYLILVYLIICLMEVFMYDFDKDYRFIFCF